MHMKAHSSDTDRVFPHTTTYSISNSSPHRTVNVRTDSAPRAQSNDIYYDHLYDESFDDDVRHNQLNNEPNQVLRYVSACRENGENYSELAILDDDSFNVDPYTSSFPDCGVICRDDNKVTNDQVLHYSYNPQRLQEDSHIYTNNSSTELQTSSYCIGPSRIGYLYDCSPNIMHQENLYEPTLPCCEPQTSTFLDHQMNDGVFQFEEGSKHQDMIFDSQESTKNNSCTMNTFIDHPHQHQQSLDYESTGNHGYLSFDTYDHQCIDHRGNYELQSKNFRHDTTRNQPWSSYNDRFQYLPTYEFHTQVPSHHYYNYQHPSSLPSSYCYYQQPRHQKCPPDSVSHSMSLSNNITAASDVAALSRQFIPPPSVTLAKPADPPDHRSTLRLTCQTCGLTFKRLGHLNDHLLTHSGVKPFACPLCGQTFNQRSNLKRHINSHKSWPPPPLQSQPNQMTLSPPPDNSKPGREEEVDGGKTTSTEWRCRFCPDAGSSSSTFKHYTDLRSHLVSHHKNELVFICFYPECHGNASFRDLESFLDHLTNGHQHGGGSTTTEKSSLSCPFCKTTFKDSKDSRRRKSSASPKRVPSISLNKDSLFVISHPVSDLSSQLRHCLPRWRREKPKCLASTSPPLANKSADDQLIKTDKLRLIALPPMSSQQHSTRSSTTKTRCPFCSTLLPTARCLGQHLTTRHSSELAQKVSVAAVDQQPSSLFLLKVTTASKKSTAATPSSRLLQRRRSSTVKPRDGLACPHCGRRYRKVEFFANHRQLCRQRVEERQRRLRYRANRRSRKTPSSFGDPIQPSPPPPTTPPLVNMAQQPATTMPCQNNAAAANTLVRRSQRQLLNRSFFIRHWQVKAERRSRKRVMNADVPCSSSLTTVIS